MHRIIQILEWTCKRLNGEKVLTVESGYYNISLPFTVTGDTDQDIIPTLTGTNCAVVVAMLITGDGNTGTCKIKKNDLVVLPCYFSAQNKSSTSPSVRIRLEAGDKLSFVTDGRGSNETFVGVTSYLGCS